MSPHRSPRFWPQAQLRTELCSESRGAVPPLGPTAKATCPHPAPDRPGADRLGAQGVPPGSRKGRSSSVGGPAYRFHFEETKNWGNGLPVSAVSWNDAWAGGGEGGSQRPDPRGGHATLTCRGRGTVFNISAGVSPFKISSGVVLHKVLPTCSFFCMYNCLFIKGFEVLSQ